MTGERERGDSLVERGLRMEGKGETTSRKEESREGKGSGGEKRGKERHGEMEREKRGERRV